MIISQKKPLEEVLTSLRKDARVFVVGCGQCATVTQTGGEEQVYELKALLEEAGKTVVGTHVANAACEELDMKLILRRHRQEVEAADAFVVLSCGAGVQSVRGATDKHVVPGTDSLFVGNVRRQMDYEEKCALCGECIIDQFGGYCPIGRCPKGITNGPCGGVQNGKCEVDLERDCVWVQIYEQLAREGRTEEFLEIKGPRRWNAVERPGRVNQRRDRRPPGDG